MTALNVNTIEEATAQYDAEAKRLLAQKPILSRILLGTMDELEGMTPEEVETCIEDELDVGTVPVGAGSAIMGGPTEDTVPGESTVCYNIHTSLTVPGDSDSMRVIVNVEAQRTYSPGYEIVTRGILYASRLISSQLGVEFEHSDYDALKKVYSIWICMNAPIGVGNAIASWAFEQTDRLGGLSVRKAAYDKAEVVIVALNEDEPSENDLIGMLNLVLSPEVPREKKIGGLEGRYNVPVKGDVAEGVNVMCNLGEYLVERSIKRGLEQGMERGMERGMECGMERGMERGRENQLMDLVIGNLKRGRSYEQIADSLLISVAEVKSLEQKALDLA